MKKFFTLIAAALLSSGAFAQAEWQDLVVNGNMEGEQNPEWSCFWTHDFPEGTVGEPQRQGFADIVEDPADPTNHCARVVARSEEVARANENIILNGENLASWDCQFFIYATDTIPQGKELRMTIRVKAEKEGSFETQAHYAPGDYNHYQLFGNINVTTEWQKIQVTATISADMTQAAKDKRMQSVAFNLSTNVEGNTFYFDDVKLEIRDPKGPEEFTGWFNMLRHETLSADKIGNYTNFTGRDGAIGSDVQARIVTDTDGQPALNVTSVGWNASRKDQVFDEEGNPVLDEEGNPTYNEVNMWIKENGDTVTNIDNWQTQFFVTVPHKFTANSKYRLVMWARADKPAQIESQTHAMPGSYIYWQGVGNLDLTEEWQRFEFDDQTVSSDQSGNGSFQTMAFNCNVLKEINNYYFRFEEFSANAADVTEAERVLASETTALPVPEPGKQEGATGTINFDNCIAMLESNSFENLVNENMTVQSGEDTFGSIDPTAGFYLADNGWLANSETPMIFEMEEVNDSDPNLNITIYNDGESFANKTVETKFRYSYNNWFYVFNVTLMPEDKYTGIDEVKVPASQNVIYDLSGRRVQKATKGLYIINGKKYVVK
ncbi:MAG: hypothetical protein K5683_08055 [Prevotella sp.]|nr:hypothetical protein [Prevotella sp.]